MSETTDEKALRLEFYKDVSENLRHYGNMRFAQMTLFVAITAGLSGAVAKLECPLHCSGIVIGIIGAIVTIIFWIMEERAADYWHHYMRRAKEMEENGLGYIQYEGRPERKYVTATNAARLLYAFVLWLWLICSCVACGRLFVQWRWPLVGVGILLSVAVIFVYVRQVVRYIRK